MYSLSINTQLLVLVEIIVYFVNGNLKTEGKGGRRIFYKKPISTSSSSPVKALAQINSIICYYLWYLRTSPSSREFV